MSILCCQNAFKITQNLLQIFWTWVRPPLPFWTMFKKTTDLGDEGTPYCVEFLFVKFNIESEGINHESDLNESFWPVQFVMGKEHKWPAVEGPPNYSLVLHEFTYSLDLHHFFISSPTVIRQIFISSPSVLHINLKFYISFSLILQRFFIGSSSVIFLLFKAPSSVLHHLFIRS